MDNGTWPLKNIKEIDSGDLIEYWRFGSSEESFAQNAQLSVLTYSSPFSLMFLDIPDPVESLFLLVVSLHFVVKIHLD
jgi:hypothetical protein